MAPKPTFGTSLLDECRDFVASHGGVFHLEGGGPGHSLARRIRNARRAGRIDVDQDAELARMREKYEENRKDGRGQSTNPLVSSDVAVVSSVCAAMRAHLLLNHGALPRKRQSGGEGNLRKRWDQICSRQYSDTGQSGHPRDRKLSLEAASVLSDFQQEMEASREIRIATAATPESLTRQPSSGKHHDDGRVAAIASPEKKQRTVGHAPKSASDIKTSDARDDPEISVTVTRPSTGAALSYSNDAVVLLGEGLRCDRHSRRGESSSQIKFVAEEGGAQDLCHNLESGYFETQAPGAWCGMHALNNFLGGPYVTRDACRRAASRVVAALSQIGNGDAEDIANHICPATGWLSIDVINVLGAGLFGITVEGRAQPWEELRRENSAAALVNWNNAHWTILMKAAHLGSWTHLNSILGLERRYGRREVVEADVEQLLSEIRETHGGVTLHRVRRADLQAGNYFLEREGMRAMVPVEIEVLPEANCGSGISSDVCLGHRLGRFVNNSLPSSVILHRARIIILPIFSRRTILLH